MFHPYYHANAKKLPAFTDRRLTRAAPDRSAFTFTLPVHRRDRRNGRNLGYVSSFGQDPGCFVFGSHLKPRKL
jgi:hypothetical protein